MAVDALWTYQKGILWVLDLSTTEEAGMALPRPVQPRITVSFEEIFLDNVDAAAKNMGSDSSEQLRRRLSLGRRFFVAKSEEAIVAYG